MTGWWASRGTPSDRRRPRSKPKVSAFINARLDKIEALHPDLVLAFSDLQADIAAALVRRGLPVFTFNQRTVAEILQMIRILGGIVGCPDRAAQLTDELTAGLDAARRAASSFPRRPRVFFEEWDDPLISGICWVDELIEITGGTPLFPALRGCSLARDRVVNPQDVAERDPELIIGSWCGKAVKKATIVDREGWGQTAAVRRGHIYEIKSTYILQPGPASLTEGLRQLHVLVAAGRRRDAPPGARASGANRRIGAHVHAGGRPTSCRSVVRRAVPMAERRLPPFEVGDAGRCDRISVDVAAGHGTVRPQSGNPGVSGLEPDARPVSSGLCGSCRHARVVRSAKGGAFSRCELSVRDERFPKYPRLPVIVCTGHEARPPPTPSAG